MLLDRMTKAVIWRWFPQVIVENPHGALGVLPGQWAVLGLVGLVAWLAVNRQWSVGLALVLAGGISNLIDRGVWGTVIDFMRLGAFSVFNLADVLLTAGVVWVIVGELFFAERRDEAGNSF
jgi:lipoprotein signal peptidase